jgi:hypothetical protein
MILAVSESGHVIELGLIRSESVVVEYVLAKVAETRMMHGWAKLNHLRLSQ